MAAESTGTGLDGVRVDTSNVFTGTAIGMLFSKVLPGLEDRGAVRAGRPVVGLDSLSSSIVTRNGDGDEVSIGSPF